MGKMTESEIEVASIKRKPPIPDSLLQAELITWEFMSCREESGGRDTANTPPNLEFELVQEVKEQLLKEMSGLISFIEGYEEEIDWEEEDDETIEIIDENVEEEDVEILTK